MPNVKVGFDPQTGMVVFGSKKGNGDVEMRGRGTIVFTPYKRKPCTFQSFKLTPEDLTQFRRTVRATKIDVDNRFTDTSEKAYKYTVVVTAPDGSTHVGDPQIVNKP